MKFQPKTEGKLEELNESISNYQPGNVQKWAISTR
jgi:hypothetical protein